ncbi:MAG: hypothetical protein M1837_004190 [Sclerophora amabilis]|nr:MAG: hypothetical protein M1837_004190 [Sclerophora amabilis]
MESKDLTTLFNWNTKQVFVWVLATWPATTTITTTSSDLSSAAAPPNSSAVIWDTIIPCAPSPSRAYLASLISTYIDSFTSYTVPGSGKSSSSSKAKSKRSKSPPKSKASTSSSSSSSTTAHASKPGLLRLSNHRGKYQITDVSGKLAGVGNATLEIGWNVQPWVGALLWTSQTSQSQPWWLEAPTSLLHKLGPWKKLRGGRSEAWSFPELKGAPKPVSTPSSEQANNP